MDFLKTLSVGVCYYPEHWDESLWESDLKRMLDNGIHTVRIGEFAWSIMEREEGQFDFSFFDRFLDLCASTGMQVIFGTPSATPPAWLTGKYPEALNANADGVLFRHGGRRHYNYNSPVYREKVALLVGKMAEHWGHHPAIVGWQIDNELNCETNDSSPRRTERHSVRTFRKSMHPWMRSMKPGVQCSGARPIRTGNRSMCRTPMPLPPTTRPFS